MKPDWLYTHSVLIDAVGGTYSGAPFAFHSISTDSRTIQEGDLFFALSGENFDGNEYVEAALDKGACAAVCTREVVEGKCVVVPDVQRAIQALAAHHRNQYDIPVLGITGSCGKTSSKDLVAALLETKYTVVKTQGNFNNEIGCPLSILTMDASTDFLVLEMGANHVGEIKRLCEIARPTESVITLIAEAHLEGFGTLEDVARAKSEIASGLQADGRFYVNTDDERCVKIGLTVPGACVTYGTGGEVSLRDWSFTDDGRMKIDIDPIGTIHLPLYVPAHIQNVLFAVAVGLQHGIEDFEEPLRQACEKAARFKICQMGEIEVIDDTYNANPASMAVAIEALEVRPRSGDRIAVLGCMGELGEEAAELHYKTGTELGKRGINRVLVRGPFAQEIVQGARASGVEVAQIYDTHEDMASALATSIKRGDTLLFKGSRGMTMEVVIDQLAEKMGWDRDSSLT